jgi:hypothetical protein
MAFPERHLLLRTGGHFGAASTELDKWSVGLRFGNGQNNLIYDGAKLSAFLSSASAALVTFHGTSDIGVSTECFLDWVTLALVGTDGKYDPIDQQTMRFDRAPLPGTGSCTKPWNTASVFSLRTAVPRGFASNGRTYYPALAATMAPGTGRWSPAALTLRLTAFKVLVNALNAASVNYQAGVKLRVYSAVGAGKSEAVTSIRCDERLDSIERRENQQPAVWQVQTVT